MTAKWIPFRRGIQPLRSTWKVAVIGVLSAAGCQTKTVRKESDDVSSTSIVSVYPAQQKSISIEAAVQTVAYRSPGLAVPTDLPPLEAFIDLSVALRLAGVDNPTINLARETIREAQADQQAARAMLLPTVHVGGNYNLHRGNLQQSSGNILDVNRQSLYLGAGAPAVGGGTPGFPGVRLLAHLGDAAYEPLAARQRVAARTADTHTVQNDILLEVATAYLELLGAEERVRILKEGEVNLAELVRLTESYAKAGQGRSADAHRAGANAQLLTRETQVAEEDCAVVAARLAGLLNLDPSVRLKPPGGSIPTIRLIPVEAELQPLLETALRNRPEAYARSADIGLAQVRRRQEAVRPFLPIVSVGLSGGAFGGNNQTTSDFGTLSGRTNFDVTAFWNLDGLGFGNRARTRRAEAGIGQALARLEQAKTDIGREVAEAHTQLQAAVKQLETATASVAIAEEGFRLEKERIQQAQGRPLEVLDSFRQLLDARLDVVRATISFDVAQFRLYKAIGRTPDLPAKP